MTMRTADQETTLSAFIQAAVSDDDWGYPHGSVFISIDEAMKDHDLVWDTLHEGHPTILVKKSGAEMLIAPVPIGFLRRFNDRVRGRMTVELAFREQPMAAPTDARVQAEIKRDSFFSNELAFACA